MEGFFKQVCNYLYKCWITMATTIKHAFPNLLPYTIRNQSFIKYDPIIVQLDLRGVEYGPTSETDNKFYRGMVVITALKYDPINAKAGSGDYNSPTNKVFDTEVIEGGAKYESKADNELLVDWGDGTRTSGVELYKDYKPSKDRYEIKIYGAIESTIVRIGGYGIVELKSFGTKPFSGIQFTRQTHLVVINSGFIETIRYQIPVPNLTKVPSVLPSFIKTLHSMFHGSPTFNSSNILSWDTSNIKSLGYTFYKTKLFNQPINVWDTSNVIDLSGLFFGAESFNKELDTWNTSKVLDISRIFSGQDLITEDNPISNLFDKEISSWDVSNVVHMDYAFYNSIFNNEINNWNTSSLMTLCSTFSNSLFNKELDNWVTSKLVSLDFTFSYSVFNQPINTWNTALIGNMAGAFEGNTVFNQPLDTWNTPQVSLMNSMFKDSSSFEQDISTWCVTKIPSEPSDFSTGSPLTSTHKPQWGLCPNNEYTPPVISEDDIPLEIEIDGYLIHNNNVQFTEWDDNVYIDIEDGFIDWGQGAGYIAYTKNDGLPRKKAFTTSDLTDSETLIIKVIIKTNTFINIEEFDAIPIRGYAITKILSWGNSGFNICFGKARQQYITDNIYVNNYNLIEVPTDIPTEWTHLDNLFYGCAYFNQDITNWDISPIKSLVNTFHGAASFTQDISSWIVDNVTSLEGTFSGADLFNIDISSWNISNVTTLKETFFLSDTFNQPLNNWDTSKVTSMELTFSNSIYNQPLNNWDVSKVTIFDSMFSKALFNQNINSWQLDSANSTINMFGLNEVYNQPLDQWDVSHINTMDLMFQKTNAFEQDISLWCVIRIKDKPNGFDYGSPIDPLKMPVWGTCPK